MGEREIVSGVGTVNEAASRGFQDKIRYFASGRELLMIGIGRGIAIEILNMDFVSTLV